MKVTNNAEGPRHFNVRDGEEVRTQVLRPKESGDFDVIEDRVFQGFVESGELELNARGDTVDLGGEEGGELDRSQLEGMTRSELNDLAAQRGVDISSARTKADAIDMLLAPPAE